MGKGRRDTGEGRCGDEVWSCGKCAGGMGEWRSVTRIMSRGEGRSPSIICGV